MLCLRLYSLTYKFHNKYKYFIIKRVGFKIVKGVNTLKRSVQSVVGRVIYRSTNNRKYYPL